MNKKQWKTPELVVLVKSQAQENVLTQCKAVHSPGANVPSATTGQPCKVRQGRCGACQGLGGGLS